MLLGAALRHYHPSPCALVLGSVCVCLVCLCVCVCLVCLCVFVSGQVGNWVTEMHFGVRVSYLHTPSAVMPTFYSCFSPPPIPLFPFHYLALSFTPPPSLSLYHILFPGSYLPNHFFPPPRCCLHLVCLRQSLPLIPSCSSIYLKCIADKAAWVPCHCVDEHTFMKGGVCWKAPPCSPIVQHSKYI